MGELVPFVALIFVAMVIVGSFFMKKQLSMKQVVKPLSEAVMVERNTYVLSVAEAKNLATALEDILKKDRLYGSYDLLMSDKILTIEVRKSKE